MPVEARSTSGEPSGAVCPRRAAGLADSPPLDGEVVVVDLTTDRVYAFNAPLTEIWAACDGITRVGEVARRLAGRFGLPADHAIVESALRTLRRHGLVGDAHEAHRPVRVNRREFGRRVRRAIPVALALPAITSILLEQPAEAAAFSLPCIRDTVCAAGLALCGQHCFAAGASATDCKVKACLRSLAGTGALTCRPVGTGACPKTPTTSSDAPQMNSRQIPVFMRRR